VMAVSAFKVDGGKLPKPGTDPDLPRTTARRAPAITGKSGSVPKLAAAAAIAGDDWEEF
jgi:hypothetical protein